MWTSLDPLHLAELSGTNCPLYLRNVPSFFLRGHVYLSLIKQAPHFLLAGLTQEVCSHQKPEMTLAKKATAPLHLASFYFLEPELMTGTSFMLLFIIKKTLEIKHEFEIIDSLWKTELCTFNFTLLKLCTIFNIGIFLDHLLCYKVHF